jgi:hypothetical protein
MYITDLEFFKNNPDFIFRFRPVSYEDEVIKEVSPQTTHVLCRIRKNRIGRIILNFSKSPETAKRLEEYSQRDLDAAWEDCEQDAKKQRAKFEQDGYVTIREHYIDMRGAR